MYHNEQQSYGLLVPAGGTKYPLKTTLAGTGTDTADDFLSNKIILDRVVILKPGLDTQTIVLSDNAGTAGTALTITFVTNGLVPYTLDFGPNGMATNWSGLKTVSSGAAVAVVVFRAV